MIIINGQRRDTVGCSDRGLQYGDGLFETFAVSAGRPLCWGSHMERLVAGCERLRIPPPDTDTLRAEADQVIDGSALGVLKIIVTRGEGSRGYYPEPQPGQTRIISMHPWPDYPPLNSHQGVRMRFCHSRLSRNPLLAGIKHLNRLEQVLARAEWDDPAIADGLMLDTDGNVIEGTMSNLFLIREGRLLTPGLRHSGVAGIMRGIVLDSIAELGMNGAEATLTSDDLEHASEIFLTNSLLGVWPVIQLVERDYPVGPLTRLIQDALNQKGVTARKL